MHEGVNGCCCCLTTIPAVVLAEAKAAQARQQGPWPHLVQRTLRILQPVGLVDHEVGPGDLAQHLRILQSTQTIVHEVCPGDLAQHLCILRGTQTTVHACISGRRLQATKHARLSR
jgi:hypothetical protein